MKSNQEIRRDKLEWERMKKKPDLMVKFWRKVSEEYEKAYKDLDKVEFTNLFEEMK